MIKSIILTLKRRQFLFEELVKRDFKQKYKRTILGMGWSILSPLLTFLVLRLIFTQFFGRSTPHYSTYLLAGTIVISYYREATRGGMNALMSNKKIITKINVPKYLFLLSKNVSSIINFFLTLLVFFVFAAIDGIAFSWKFITILYPILCLTLLNIGVGLVLSALFVFFRDTQYLYDVFLTLLHYTSAIFYTVDSYPIEFQRLFLINPVYCAIKYIRTVVIGGVIPGIELHVLLFFYAFIALIVGAVIYKKKNHEFLYYM